MLYHISVRHKSVTSSTQNISRLLSVMNPYLKTSKKAAGMSERDQMKSFLQTERHCEKPNKSNGLEIHVVHGTRQNVHC
jgi:hypothetical protein